MSLHYTVTPFTAEALLFSMQHITEAICLALRILAGNLSRGRRERVETGVDKNPQNLVKFSEFRGCLCGGERN